MIEGIVLHIDGQEIKTRLHEHGKERYMGRLSNFTGYFDGEPEAMQLLRKTAPDPLHIDIVENGFDPVVLSGIKWGEAQEMYEGHWIVHLEWEKETAATR